MAWWASWAAVMVGSRPAMRCWRACRWCRVPESVLHDHVLAEAEQVLGVVPEDGFEAVAGRFVEDAQSDAGEPLVGLSRIAGRVAARWRAGWSCRRRAVRT